MRNFGRTGVGCMRFASIGLRVILLVLAGFGMMQPILAAPRTTTVAVMPFRDLSGGSSHVGEAIRETVASDLREISSLRVVERGQLDRVLAEQGLQVRKTDLDVSAVVKLGKVLGASLIVVGAYQKVATQLRLTARFVKVETSEVVGTAKVDGTTREFLRLQDRITAALLRSAGFPIHARKVEEDTGKRPELGSIKTLELYGQAALAQTDEERQKYLRAAIAEEKNFSYAAKDLEALEKRLQQYQAAAQPMLDRELESYRARIRSAPDRGQAALLMFQYITQLSNARKLYTLVRETQAYLKQLPPEAEQEIYIDSIAYILFQTELSLYPEPDAALRDGEWFLKHFPKSAYFATVKAAVEQTIEKKRSLEEAWRKVQAELPEKGKDDPWNYDYWNLCTVGWYLGYNTGHYAAAVRFLEACGNLGMQPWNEVYPLLVQASYYGKQWSDLRKHFEAWQKLDPVAARAGFAPYQGSLPVDE